MKLTLLTIALLTLNSSVWASDLNDGISVSSGISSTNDDLKIKRNYEFLKMNIKAKIEKAKYDPKIVVIDGCGGAGNINVVGMKGGTLINNSNNSGAVTSCEK